VRAKKISLRHSKVSVREKKLKYRRVSVREKKILHSRVSEKQDNTTSDLLEKKIVGTAG